MELQGVTQDAEVSPAECRDEALRGGTPKHTPSSSVDYNPKLQNQIEAADDASRPGDIHQGSSSPHGGSSQSIPSLGVGSIEAGSNVSVGSLGMVGRCRLTL